MKNKQQGYTQAGALLAAIVITIIAGTIFTFSIIKTRKMSNELNELNEEFFETKHEGYAKYTPEIAYNFDQEVLDELMVELKNTFGGEFGQLFVLFDIIDQGPEAIPTLINTLDEIVEKELSGEKLTSGERATKRSLIDLLAKWQAEEALIVLEKILVKFESSGDLSATGRAVGQIGGDKSYQILKNLLEYANENPDDKLSFYKKRAAMMGLWYSDDSRAVSLLKEVLNDETNDLDMRVAAAAYLGAHGNTDGLAIATEGAQSDDSSIKRNAALALGMIGSTEALRTLNTLEWSDAKEEVVSAIILAEANQLIDDEKINFIKESLLETPGNFLNMWGTYELRKIGVESAVNALKELTEIFEDPWLAPSEEHIFLQYNAIMVYKTIR